MAKILVFDFLTHGGGIGKFLGRLLHLIAEKHEVMFLDPYENENVAKQFGGTKVKIVRLGIWPRITVLGWGKIGTRIFRAIPLLFFYGVYAIRLLFWLIKNRPDIVWTNQKKSTVFMSPLARLLKFKHLYVAHGFSSAKDISGFFRKALMGVNSIVAVSGKVKEQLLEAGLRNVKVIYNGVPIPAMPKTPKRDGLVIFGIAATLQEIKGIHIALEAIGLIGENLLLEIAGDIAPGGDRSYVERLKAMADSRVRFLGWVDNIHEVIGNWDALLVPSLMVEESFSLSAAEAMSMGIPVIASRIGGVQEVVGDAGILVTPGAVDELAKAIKKMATEPETRLKMGIAARDRAHRLFSLEKQVEAYMDLIEKLGPSDK